MTLHAIEPNEASHKLGRRPPMWVGAACLLAAVIIGMVIVAAGFGVDHTAKAVNKTPGEYYRAVQWSGHWSMTTQYLALGIILSGLLIGILGISWRTST